VLAERADASLMKQVLRQARDGDASWLARYFLRYPDGEATANIRGRVAGRYSEKYNLAFALAALGDQGVVDWALERLDDPLPPPNDYNSLAWVPYYVIASSPLPEARKVTDELRSLGGLPRQWINEARTVSPAFMPE